MNKRFAFFSFMWYNILTSVFENERGKIMAYVALYRSYRPSSFKEVIGQKHVVQTLKNAVMENKTSHAYIFSGLRGIGKTTIARIFAKAVNCENQIDGEPCNHCKNCLAIINNETTDIVELDAASNNGVDNIRQIREEVQYSPTEGRFKVYIIDEVHMLSIGAFNALLKTLEEPPAYVIFILATTEVAKIPITILSRCQRYDFHRITIETIAGRLSELMKAEGLNVEDKAIKYVAKAADGSMRDALSLLDQCLAFYLGKDLKYENVLDVLGAVDTAVFSKMLSTILSGDVAVCMSLMEDLIMQGRDLSQFVTDFIWYLRNLLLIKTTKDAERIEDVIEVSADNLEDLKKDAQNVDIDTLMYYIRVLSELSNDLKFSTQKRVKTEITFIKLMRPAMDNSQDIGDVVSRVTMLEGQLQKVLDDIKSGRLVNAGAAGGQAAVQQQTPKKPVVKRVYDAVPEDVKAIAAGWKDIIATIDDPVNQTFLQAAHVTLAEDGISLEIMVESLSAYNSLSRQEVMESIENVIEERTGVRVSIKVTKLNDDEDFHSRFVDLKELVGIDIEVDDKEELI